MASVTVNIPVATASAAALAPALAVGIGAETDTANTDNGRIREGRATVTITRPVAGVPAGVSRGERYDKAIALPTPTMVDGIPT